MTFELADMARKDRREIAMRCLQGLLSGGHGAAKFDAVKDFPLHRAKRAAAVSVVLADALIAELDKHKEA